MTPEPDIGAWFANRVDEVIETPNRGQRIRIVAVRGGDVVVQRLDARSLRSDHVPVRVLQDVVARVRDGKRVETSRIINGKAGPVAALLNDLPSVVVSGRPQVASNSRGRAVLSPSERQAEPDEPMPSGWEGDPKLVLHFRRERDAALRGSKLAGVLEATGALGCEICGFDFFQRYGEHGRGFAECHHIRPLSDGKRETLIEDLVVLCANCHRMIHRSSVPLEVDALREMLG